MPPTESFPTKRGTARFTGECVHFEESFSRHIQSLYQEYCQNGTWWHNGIFVGYILAFPIGLWWIVGAVRGGDFLLLAVVGGSIAVLWMANYARGFRSPDRIRLDAIREVSATDGTKGLTRPRLVITYTDGETTYRRRVNLPSLYTSNGETAYEQAQAAFAEHGL
jgi:hypothetical protein